jgi:hypothetical protein
MRPLPYQLGDPALVRDERLELPWALSRDEFTARLLPPICILTRDWCGRRTLNMAAKVGFEPTPYAVTVRCTTVVLLGNIFVSVLHANTEKRAVT